MLKINHLKGHFLFLVSQQTLKNHHKVNGASPTHCEGVGDTDGYLMTITISSKLLHELTSVQSKRRKNVQFRELFKLSKSKIICVCVFLFFIINSLCFVAFNILLSSNLTDF